MVGVGVWGGERVQWRVWGCSAVPGSVESGEAADDPYLQCNPPRLPRLKRHRRQCVYNSLTALGRHDRIPAISIDVQVVCFGSHRHLVSGPLPQPALNCEAVSDRRHPAPKK